MEIIGKIKKEGFLRMCDLEIGECFCFLDSDELCMITDEDKYLNFANNQLYDTYSDEEDRPIKRIKAEIVIKD